jgi:dihydrofolate reductase
MISAVSMNGIIGDSHTNTIPWYLPADLKHFKEITTNGTVVMGAKTYNSLGRNLPKRRNVVITRGHTPLIANPDATYPSIEDVLRNEHEDFFIIGGQHIYGESLRLHPHTLYITIVNIDGDGDVRFPVDGRRFTQDEVNVSDTLKYNCTRRSEWFEENGIKYQFTKFTKFGA